MINYYKILGVENYASTEVVKAAYKEKIREFHPDINPSDDAAEIAKYLNIAKDILTDNQQKEAYDLKLKIAYVAEIQRLKSSKPRWSPINILERKRKMEERQKLREKDKYLKGLKLFPFKWRISILSILGCAGLVIVHQNYFIQFPGYERIYAILGFALFVASLVILSNQVYTFYWITSLDKEIKFNYERWIARVLVLLMLLGPFSIYAVNEYRKEYYFSTEKEYEYLFAKIRKDLDGRGKTVYEYEVDGETFLKYREKRNGIPIVTKDGHILIKYAVDDPSIAEAVLEKF